MPVDVICLQPEQVARWNGSLVSDSQIGRAPGT